MPVVVHLRLGHKYKSPVKYDLVQQPKEIEITCCQESIRHFVNAHCERTE